MVERQIQVDPGSYRRKYLSLPRMITHWHQADSVADAVEQGSKVLEIGPGAGHTTWILRQWGIDVTTLDFDPALKPDIVGDATNLPCEANSFDCILAAEVLEHIPFSEFGKALAEFRRVSRSRVIVTLPAPFVGLSALLNMVGLTSKGLYLGIPYWVTHRFDGEHHWELGKRGYSVGRIKRAIGEQGFKVLGAFRPAPSRYCYFFVLDCNK